MLEHATTLQTRYWLFFLGPVSTRDGRSRARVGRRLLQTRHRRSSPKTSVPGRSRLLRLLLLLASRRRHQARRAKSDCTTRTSRSESTSDRSSWSDPATRGRASRSVPRRKPLRPVPLARDGVLPLACSQHRRVRTRPCLGARRGVDVSRASCRARRRSKVAKVLNTQISVDD